MNRKDQIVNEYFDWMYALVCGGNHPDSISYKKLLMQLHAIPFTYKLQRDKNRADDGEDLRYRFVWSNNYENCAGYLNGPCSVLEMIMALAIRCEENIMDDPAYGDRTAQWFWGMIANLGLGAMNDEVFDREYVRDVISIFLNRKYERNGKGGLFTIRDCDKDLRKVEIWYQLNWYLDEIV